MEGKRETDSFDGNKSIKYNDRLINFVTEAVSSKYGPNIPSADTMKFIETGMWTPGDCFCFFVSYFHKTCSCQGKSNFMTELNMDELNDDLFEKYFCDLIENVCERINTKNENDKYSRINFNQRIIIGMILELESNIREALINF